MPYIHWREQDDYGSLDRPQPPCHGSEFIEILANALPQKPGLRSTGENSHQGAKPFYPF
jgi:hypothetical protein